MSQNSVQQNSQSITIPHGWQPPKFQLGQLVEVRVWFGAGRYEKEFGAIAGFAYHGVNSAPNREFESSWEYDVALSSESPGWFCYGGIIIAEEDDLIATSTFSTTSLALVTVAIEHCELVLR